MIARGQIYFVDLDPTQGREQSGYRPVLVVSADSINRQPLVISVIVGTDATHLSRDYPTNIRVTAAESGLPRDTVFLAFQLRSLDPARFPAAPVAALPPARMADVEQSLRRVLSLN